MQLYATTCNRGQLMTTLAKNLKRLREHHNFTKEHIARLCTTTAAAVAQWETLTTAYVPKVNKLLTLALLYKTTIEELYTNPKIVPGEIVSPILDNEILIKVFTTLANSETISYAFDQARVKRRAYFFTLLYSLCKEIEDSYLDETEVIPYMDPKNVRKKTEASKGTGKHLAVRAKSTPKKNH